MKYVKITAVLLIVCLVLSFCALSVCAESNEYGAYFLRAGGGSSGGGGGGTGGGSHRSHSNGSNELSTPMDIFEALLKFVFICFLSRVIYKLNRLRGANKSKKLLAMLEKKDSAWKFKNLQKTVEDSYYIIQKSWSNMDMTPAKDVMSEELFDNFQTQLAWMKQKRERNVLEKIKLIDAIPVSVYDSEDDSMDYVWYYINGSIVDYKIDTDTNEIIDGNRRNSDFVEYWMYVRTPNGKWGLDKILQEDEADQFR